MKRLEACPRFAWGRVRDAAPPDARRRDDAMAILRGEAATTQTAPRDPTQYPAGRLGLVGPVLVCLTLAVAPALKADDDILYRRDANGTLVLTNVPDHGQLRRYRAGRVAATLHRGDEFRAIIESAALEQGIHPDLVYAVAEVESNFDPWAVSIKGAQGLMQLMPGTSRSLGVVNAFNPTENVRGGARFLRRLLDRFDGDKRLALAAYNAGENAVLAADRAIPPYRETRNYVRKVLRIFGEGRTPYAVRGRRPRASGVAPRLAPIYRYTDEQGIVHYSDSPPVRPVPEAESAGAPR